MGKRGPSSFKKLDALRAINTAREAGLEPAIVEIETKDGTTFRVYGDKAVPAETTKEVMSSKEWDAEIEKLKAKGAPKTKAR
jgi:hypothetical protein